MKKPTTLTICLLFIIIAWFSFKPAETEEYTAIPIYDIEICGKTFKSDSIDLTEVSKTCNLGSFEWKVEKLGENKYNIYDK